MRGKRGMKRRSNEGKRKKGWGKIIIYKENIKNNRR